MERVLLFSDIGIINIYQCRQANNCIIYSCSYSALGLAALLHSLSSVLWLTDLFVKFQVPFSALATPLTPEDSFTEFIRHIYQE